MPEVFPPDQLACVDRVRHRLVLSSGGDPVIAAVIDLTEHVDNFRRRTLVDALQEAESSYWITRSAAFLAARSKPGEFTGKASRADLAARDVRLEAVARACRARAELAPLQDNGIDDALGAVLDEVTR